MTHHRGTEDAEGPSARRSSNILGAAIEVHRRLGPGLLESVYEACLCRELLFRRIPIERQVPLPLNTAA
jgi:GxxExxY protein